MRVTPEINTKIEELIAELTLEEKVSLCHANSVFNAGGVERLGMDELTMMDGPHGVRAEVSRDSWDCLNQETDDCTYLPTETALAATWNPELARLFGETLGSEARYRGKDIILGPGVNIIRTPLCGRNFEYMSEDPCLIQKMGPELVKGIESQDTAACVKHYCLNNQELDRFGVNVEVSRRALHEIYLKGFYSTIIEGGASSVMGAYNKYQNQYCCHNDYLVNQVLKDDWGFEGVFLTDWGGAHDTDECIYNGLDIEMGTGLGEKLPFNQYYLAEPFLKKAKESEEVRNLLDDKVRRILRLMFSVNKFSPDRNPGEFNTKEHQQATYDIAAEGMVLLKNKDQVLPIDKSKLKKMLVVGPNADVKHAAGGSSSGVHAFYEITPLQGIRERLSDVCEIDYETGKFGIEYQTIPLQTLGIIDFTAGSRSYKQIAYTKGEDEKVIECATLCETPNISKGQADAYDIQCFVEIPEDGKYSFKFSVFGDMNVEIQGATPERVEDDYHYWSKYLTYHYNLVKGEKLTINVHAVRKYATLDFEFGWITPRDYASSSTEEQLLRKAAEADYVIYCGGLDHGFDTESIDKKSMKLPSEQDNLIPKLVDANPNTVVALTAGSPVSMPWIDKAKAVIWNWYGGMEVGHVLCDILTGDICPSGKMPFTLPKDYEDHPVARYGEYKAGNCKYCEDILVGYRGFDYDNIEPLFPFGHGISYSTFEYSDLNIQVGEQGATISLKVKNTGTVKAKEIVQVYIGDVECSVKRPPKELRNFEKVELEPEETTEVSLNISSMDLAFYDEMTEKWKVEDGEFVVYVGSSSRDIRLTGSFWYGNTRR